MTPQTNTFLSVTSQTGAVDGDWFSVRPSQRTHIPIAISVTAGTATWTIQGRNSPNDEAVVIATGSATDAVSALRMAQMRVSLSDASGADVEATGDQPMRAIA